MNAKLNAERTSLNAELNDLLVERIELNELLVERIELNAELNALWIFERELNANADNWWTTYTLQSSVVWFTIKQ